MCEREGGREGEREGGCVLRQEERDKEMQIAIESKSVLLYILVHLNPRRVARVFIALLFCLAFFELGFISGSFMSCSSREFVCSLKRDSSLAGQWFPADFDKS